MVIAYLSGCATLGVQPDLPDFQDNASASCAKYHPDDKASQFACWPYEEAYLWATDLKKAHLTKGRANEWAVYVGGTVALASVGALAGLAAFGLAGSDAAKIIPLTGGFLGGVLTYFNNDARATAYYEAIMSIDAAMTDAEKVLVPSGGTGRDAKKYNDAFQILKPRVDAVESDLQRKLETIRTAGQQSIKDKVALQTKADQLLLLAYYPAVGVKDPDPPDNPTQLEITLKQAIASEHLDLAKQWFRVRIDQTTLMPSGIQNATVTVTLPDSVKKKGLPPHSIALLVAEQVAGAIFSKDLNYTQ